MNYGHIMLDGTRFPVVDVKLQRGSVVITGVVGPVVLERRLHGVITVFGADGRGVCQGTKPVTVERDPAPATYTVTYTLHVDRVAED